MLNQRIQESKNQRCQRTQTRPRFGFVCLHWYCYVTKEIIESYQEVRIGPSGVAKVAKFCQTNWVIERRKDNTVKNGMLQPHRSK